MEETDKYNFLKNQYLKLIRGTKRNENVEFSIIMTVLTLGVYYCDRCLAVTGRFPL